MGCSPSTSSTPVCQSEEVVLRLQEFHDKYMLGVKLGRGAFAQVRACSKISTGPLRPNQGEDDGEKQQRAVKILDMRDKDKSKEGSTQVQKSAHNEATVWKTVGNHPNCVRLYDLFFGPELCYMVMEKCGNGLLKALESMPELTERGLGNVFAQMLLGIAHCHSVKVVHRDIKPDNFLVGGEDGQVVKLCDFGLSAVLPKQGKLPGVFGTAPFMCPEMLAGRWYDEKADVWSFAVIVYVLMFGLFPYMPKQQSSKAMKEAIIEGVPSPSFEPVQRGTGPNSGTRSHIAVQLVKSLLVRTPETRPSAEEALHSPWMSSAMHGCHMTDAELPSLRPMLHAAKKVGAFEVRDPSRDSSVDILLNNLQMQAHNVPLPVTISPGALSRQADNRRPTADHAIRKLDDQRMGSKGRSGSKLQSSGNGSENASNRSTSCDSSSNSGINDHGHGSGWSKGSSLDTRSAQSASLSQSPSLSHN